MLQALLLIAVGATCRLIPHFVTHDTWNLVPIGAIALFAGSRFPKQFAWAVPVFAMVFADIIMDQKYGNYFHSPTRWISYATYASIALLGILARDRRAGGVRLAGLSLAGSLLFFLVSNFCCWAWPEGGTIYPASFSGLMTCYAAGLPFFRNTVIGDLAGTAILFGLVPFFSNAWRNHVSTARASETGELVAAGTSSTN